MPRAPTGRRAPSFWTEERLANAISVLRESYTLSDAALRIGCTVAGLQTAFYSRREQLGGTAQVFLGASLRPVASAGQQGARGQQSNAILPVSPAAHRTDPAGQSAAARGHAEGNASGVRFDGQSGSKGQTSKVAESNAEHYAGAATVMGRVARTIARVGDQRPGLHVVAHLTDPHHGSRFNDAAAMLEFARIAVEEGCEAVVCTGDIIDGPKAVLAHEQRCVGVDEQRAEAVEVWSTSAFRKHGIPVVAEDGNHDGYAYGAIGMEHGKVLEADMRAAGMSWVYVGQCLGRAIVCGARWEMWHPHGGSGSHAAVKRVMKRRADSYVDTPDDRPHVLALGHFHRACSLWAPEDPIAGRNHARGTFCISGGTFQQKGSEFANRITEAWDVGASIVTYRVRDDGTVGDFDWKFIAAVRSATGWAA